MITHTEASHIPAVLYRTTAYREWVRSVTSAARLRVDLVARHIAVSPHALAALLRIDAVPLAILDRLTLRTLAEALYVAPDPVSLWPLASYRFGADISDMWAYVLVSHAFARARCTEVAKAISSRVSFDDLQAESVIVEEPRTAYLRLREVGHDDRRLERVLVRDPLWVVDYCEAISADDCGSSLDLERQNWTCQRLLDETLDLNPQHPLRSVISSWRITHEL